MAEEQGDLVDGNPCEQHLDRKRIPEHVRMAAFERPIGLGNVGQLEETPIASLPIGHRALR